jgi:hypothetical protein
MFHLLKPGRVVDQGLKRRAGLVDLLQVEAIGYSVLVAVNVAAPPARLKRKNRINTGVEGGYFCRSQSTLQ